MTIGGPWVTLLVVSGVVPWVITTVIAAVTAAAGWARWHVERELNKVLRKQAELSERQPKLQILELGPTGGGTFVDFTASVQNVGTKATRPTLTARVGDDPVTLSAEIPDLLPDAAPTRVTIWVPRPELGELMKECNDATTLYGKTLHLRLVAEGQDVEETWPDLEYDRDTDHAHWEIQQEYWRRGRGEETVDDLRAEARRAHEKRIESSDDDSGRFIDV